MGNKPTLLEFVVDQLGEGITARAMFGEHGLYRKGVLIGLMCNDRLYLKRTEAARELLPRVVEAPAYPGAKPSFLVHEEYWDDEVLMSTLAEKTARELGSTPQRKKKTAKKRRRGGTGGTTTGSASSTAGKVAARRTRSRG